MTLIRITPPASTPVSLMQAQEHLRVDSDYDASLVTDLIAAATDYVDGPDGILGRALITQTWELRLDGFPRGPIALPLPPCQSVESISYLDRAGVLQSLASFRVTGLNSSTSARIEPTSGTTWPANQKVSEAVTVRFVAGYGDPSSVPAAIKQAILMKCGTSYDERSSVVFGGSAKELPGGMLDSLAAYRVAGF